MKVIAYTSLILLASCATMQSASAEGEGGAMRGARFNYAPNVWRSESAHLPKGYGEYADPAHTVRPGAVASKDALGLDPMLLSKPAPPGPMPTPMVSAQVSAPRTNASYTPAFGKPMVAQLPNVIPQQAHALPINPVKPVAPTAAAPAQAAPKTQMVASHNLSGRLRTPIRHTASPASATPQVASYGDKFYTAAPYLPSTVSSSSVHASTRLNGRILTHHSSH